jgi:hypothetical protein
MDTAEANPSPTDTPETVDTASTDMPVQSDSDAPGATDTLSPNEVTLIAWEDLMPEGEEERLTELYEEFYREFEKRLMQQQSTLMSSGEDNQDLSLSLISEGSDMDTMEQIGTFNVVDDLDGMKIRLPGYIVPLDFSADAEHREFLLVPYFGACLHTPPPPPNQIVFVSAEPPAKIPNIYDPVWLEGTLTTGRFDTDMGNSAYELSLSKLEPYEF